MYPNFSAPVRRIGHRLLRRQLFRIFGTEIAPEGEWGAFLQVVSDTYFEADRERQLVENALEVNGHELSEANNKLRLFIDNAPAGIVMLDREMRYLFASRRWLQDRRITLQDVVGKNHYEAYPAAERWKEVHRRCLTGVTESCDEDPIPQPDGRIDWIRWEIRPWYDADGEVGGIILMSEDITERKKADESLKLLLLEYQAILDNASLGIAFTRDRTFLRCNQRFGEMFGWHSDELIGQPTHILYPSPEAFAELGRSAAETLGVGKPMDVELLMKKRDGSLFWCRMLGNAIDPSDRSKGTIFSTEDITERKRTQEQLRIAAVAFQSRDSMMVTDARGIIMQVNQAFTDVTGYSSADAVGKTPSLLHSGRQDAAFYRNLWEAIVREGHWEGEIWNRRKDGGIYPEWLSISGIKDAAGKLTHYLGIFSDISDPREAERKILKLAFYDPLTGLPNRRLLHDRLQQALASSGRSGQFGALLLLDLDHFKTINDTRGHDVGDELLVEIARRLQVTLRETDSAARLGGDEFVVLLEGLNEEQVAAATVAESIAEKLRAAICRPITLKGEMRHITPSIGVTLFCGIGEGLDASLKQADLALYQAKDAGRNTIRFYNPAMQAAVDARAKLESGLLRALAEEEFVLYYQPQVDADGALIGAEALLRWQPPGQAMMSPADFIPAAEDCGLIVPIGGWVLETACQQLAAWADNPTTANLVLAVNISARQFRQPDFIDQVQMALQRNGAHPERLKLELTESLLLEDVAKVIGTMQTLKDLGIGFSIDDFGTGYSSLAYLKRLPLDQIKIDQSFVRDIVIDADDRAIVQAIISLASNLGLQVIAEGVETEEQRDFLACHGCCAYQGYLFSRPLPIEAFAPFLKAWLDKSAFPQAEGQSEHLRHDFTFREARSVQI
ncbi:MAG: EAL domain-containing protein [Rhodocyclaceae bacterium]